MAGTILQAVGAARADILGVVRRYWGFDRLRPLQAEAIDAALAGRDSLVVLPTGGGKSLCYQVPPAVDGATDIVISPLISLMKDQVDGLTASGYPAAAIHSGIDAQQRREIENGVLQRKYRLLFVAPERAVTSWFENLARRLNVRRFAIDEAHCISHWGHDFRPEYRQLVQLRDKFPQATLHAFTATATPRVRDDVLVQLGLRDPAVLVGNFDRPNLIYRILPLVDVVAQSVETIRRHAGEAVIVYCISRKDTENLAATFQANGIQAEAYHAGMDSGSRHRVQEAFADERLNVVVATVAFGMGIDRSNVRCVLHTAMPKSIEHYQQETGRAGRDGLEAECVLLYSMADAIRWERLMQKSAENAENPADVVVAQTHLLKQMQRLCNVPHCRHRVLLEYFGQQYDRSNCGACDVCLGDVQGMEQATVTAQKVLSCVARVEERYGVGHIVDVLTGAGTEGIRRAKHDQLSTYGLLRDLSKKQVQSLVYQLVDQGLVDRAGDERPVLTLNDASWAVLRGDREVVLHQPKRESPRKSKVEDESWEGVDRGLFEHLRQWRLEIARRREVPPYVVFNDSTLRSLARVRPTNDQSLRQVSGIGEKRLSDYGADLLGLIAAYCRENASTTDQAQQTHEPEVTYVKPKQANAAKQQAFEMFRQSRPIDDVKHTVGRARGTVIQYLIEFIVAEQPASIEHWVGRSVYRQIAEVAATIEERRLSPIFQRLDGRISYDEIRLVLAHLESQAAG